MALGHSPSDIELLLIEVRQTARRRVEDIVNEEASFAKDRVEKRVAKMLDHMQAEARANYDRIGQIMQVDFQFKFHPTKDNDNG